MNPIECPRCGSCAAVATAHVIACSACGWREINRSPAIRKGASHPGHTNPSKPSKGSRPSRAAHK